MNAIKNQIHPYSSEYCLYLSDQLVCSNDYVHDNRDDDIYISNLDEMEPDSSKWDFHSNKRIERKVEFEYNFIVEK